MQDSDVVRIRYGRIKALATHLGTQSSNVCPLHDGECYNQRVEDIVSPDDECSACWLHWFLTGE